MWLAASLQYKNDTFMHISLTKQETTISNGRVEAPGEL